jgi:hypothetical protein
MLRRRDDLKNGVRHAAGRFGLDETTSNCSSATIQIQVPGSVYLHAARTQTDIAVAW